MHPPTMPGGRVPPWRHLAEDLRCARASLAVLGLMIVVQLGVSLAGMPDGVFLSLGLSRDGLLGGRLWQLASYALLHGGWLHLVLNAMLVLSFGARLERIGHHGLMLTVLGAGVLAGGLGHLILAPADQVLVGISGGAVAMLVWLATVSPESRMWPLPVSGRSLGLGILIASGVFALIDPQASLPGLSRAGEWLERWVPGTFGVSHVCHFAGGLAGWMMARRTLRPRVTLARLQAERARRELAEQGSERGP